MAGETQMFYGSLDPGGFILEKYRVLEKLSEGGMGIVYRAEHILLNKTVALKTLRPELLSNDDLVARFLTEARSVANLSHPHICQVLDFGSAAGSFYLVTEFLEGKTIRGTVDGQGPLPQVEILRVLSQIADGLEAAHAIGVIHRDLKPENVILVRGPDGRSQAKIVDFGIAKLKAPAGDAPVNGTQAGIVMGTPGYMPPEQAAGKPVDERSDLYSLGAMAYELLSGERPFKAETPVEEMVRHIRDLPKPLDPSVPPALAALVMSLLEKDPANRPPSATAVKGSLEAIARDGSATDPGVRAVTAAASPISIKIVLAIAGAIIVVLLVLAAVRSIPPSQPAPVATAKTWPFIDVSTPELEELANKPEATRVLDLIQTGQYREALDGAKKLEAAQGKTAALSFIAGIAGAMGGDNPASLAAYRSALENDVRFKKSEGIRGLALKTALTRDAPGGKTADEILVQYYADDRTVLGSLSAPACEVGRLDKKAGRLLFRMGAHTGLDDWCRLVIRLNNAEKCADRKAIVEEIESLGDPRALPALNDLKIRKGNFFSGGDLNLCLDKVLPRAKKALLEKAR